MLSFINLPAKIIGFLEANVSARETAAGVSLGMFLGFVPLNGPMAFALTVFFFVFKFNRLSALLTLPLFKLVYALGASSLADKIGAYLLIDAGYLDNFWRWFTNLPVIAFLDFNNTLVTGGIALSLVLLLPVYLIAKRITVTFKNTYTEKMKNSKFAKSIKSIKFVHKVITKVEKISCRIEK